MIKMAKITLVLGGTRSGKSLHAEALADKSTSNKIYIATSEILDAEMAERVKIHKDRRGDGWQTIEEPLEIAKIIKNTQQAVILLDCLTLWLSNLLHKELEVIPQIDILIEELRATQAEVILVSNEVGMGIVPENALARKFRDYAGILHQRIAEIADEVVLVVAGIPVKIKG